MRLVIEIECDHMGCDYNPKIVDRDKLAEVVREVADDISGTTRETEGICDQDSYPCGFWAFVPDALDTAAGIKP
jgi:hypothetical protein